MHIRATAAFVLGALAVSCCGPGVSGPSCGGAKAPCCAMPPLCNPGTACGADGNCAPCGSPGQLCCDTAEVKASVGRAWRTIHARRAGRWATRVAGLERAFARGSAVDRTAPAGLCGGMGESCCAGGASAAGAACEAAHTCVACGAPGEPCCVGDACRATGAVCGMHTCCVACGGIGQLLLRVPRRVPPTALRAIPGKTCVWRAARPVRRAARETRARCTPRAIPVRVRTAGRLGRSAAMADGVRGSSRSATRMGTVRGAAAPTRRVARSAERSVSRGSSASAPCVSCRTAERARRRARPLPMAACTDANSVCNASSMCVSRAETTAIRAGDGSTCLAMGATCRMGVCM